MADLIRYSLSGETSNWGESLGEFSIVEGGATPSPHLGGKEGGLRRRARPPALRSTMFSQKSSIPRVENIISFNGRPLKEVGLQRRSISQIGSIAQLARRDSLTLCTLLYLMHPSNPSSLSSRYVYYAFHPNVIIRDQFHKHSMILRCMDGLPQAHFLSLDTICRVVC